MKRMFYQILNLFNKCDHAKEKFVKAEMRTVPYKTVLVTKDIYECIKCGKTRYSYTYQRN